MSAEKKPAPWKARGDASDRRDTIMRGLNSVLRKRRGATALRMKDVADHLGLVKGNLYYYFKSKEDLIYHCHVKCAQASLDALARARQADGTPGKRLHALLMEHILAMTEGDYGAVLLADMEGMNAAQRRAYVRLRDEFELGVRALIKQGVAAGEFAVANVRTAGFAMLGAINWIPKWYQPDGPLDARTIARQYADLFLRALRAA
ncbi:MAG: TetR/AcrR family transcriptional regulator [Burkholderiales bacterium]